MKVCALFLLPCLLVICANARDWHSADGRTLAGTFVKLAGETLTLKSATGQPVNVPVKALSADDQTYARTAQTLDDGAVKLGPQSFECTLALADGALCRMAQKLGNGTVIFAGEQFYLMADTATLPSKGERLKNQFLFFAGQHVLHPLHGDAITVRCFALTAERAMSAASDPVDIYEPMIEQIELRGLGYPIGDGGLILVDSKLLSGTTSITVDLGKDLEPGKVLSSNSDLGITIVGVKSPTTGMRLAPRKPIELGQAVTVLSLKPGQYAKSLETPVVTEGTITNLSASNGVTYFEHNAPRDPEAIGGLVLSAKGDVLGIMTERAIVKRGTSKDGVLTREQVPEQVLTTALRTDALMPFLKSIPKVTATRSPTGADEKDLKTSLHKTAVMVRVIRETRKDMSPAAVAAAEASATKDPNALRYSISKSGTRHNSTCDNFNPKNLCKSTDGTPCKKCGG